MPKPIKCLYCNKYFPAEMSRCCHCGKPKAYHKLTYEERLSENKRLTELMFNDPLYCRV